MLVAKRKPNQRKQYFQGWYCLLFSIHVVPTCLLSLLIKSAHLDQVPFAIGNVSVPKSSSLSDFDKNCVMSK